MTECKLCPDNKISEEKAGICSECPQGTAANEQHTECGNLLTLKIKQIKFYIIILQFRHRLRYLNLQSLFSISNAMNETLLTNIS